MPAAYLPYLLLFSMVATCIEVDISVPGFPEIAQYFQVSEGIIQLTIAYNFLGYCIGAFIYGPLSESFGRRTIMLIGSGIMVLGAVGCVYAESIEVLLLSRFIQGLGASTAIVLVFAIIADVYEGPQAMKYIGMINATIGILMAGAPVVGGFINEYVGWRGNYMAVCNISLISWLLLIFFLPETKKDTQPLSIGLHLKNYSQLLFNRNFMSAALTPSLLFAGYMAYIAASAFLYKGHFQLSTMEFVAHQALIIGSFSFVSLFANTIIEALGQDKTVLFGLGLSGIAAIALVFTGFYLETSPNLFTSFLCLFSIGFAACYPVIFARSMSIFPAMHGAVSSAIMGIRALLVAGFTGVAGHLYNGEPQSVAIPVAVGIVLGIFFAILPSKQTSAAN